MADSFEGRNRGPGEEANEGFKVFGLSVNQFAATVAGLAVLQSAVGKQVDTQAKADSKKKKHEQDIAKSQSQAAQDTVAAAETQKDIAREAKRNAQKQGRNLIIWGKITASFKNAVSTIKDKTKSGLGDMFGDFRSVISNLGGIIKQFAAKFIVVFTLTQLLTKILARLIGKSDFIAQSRRAFGNQFADSGQAEALVNKATARARQLNIPISPEDVAEIARSLNRELDDSTRLTGEMVGNVKLLARGLNGDVAQAAQFMGRALRTTDATAEQVYQTFVTVAQVAADAGLNVDEMTNALAANVDLAQQFNLATDRGRMLFARSAAEARLLGTDLGAVRSFGDNLFDLGSAADFAGRAQSLGLTNLNATEVFTGAVDDPTELMVGLLTQLQQQFGDRQAFGDDRLVVDAIIKTLPELGTMFGGIEGVSKAIIAAGSEDMAALRSRVDDATLAADAAENFERNALTSFETMITQGDSLEQTLDDLSSNLANTIADVLFPFFQQLISVIRELIDTLSNRSFFSKSSTAMVHDKQLIATGDFLRTKFLTKLEQFDTDKSGTVGPEEISAMVQRQTDIHRRSGLNVTAEDQEKLVQGLLELARIQKNYLNKTQKIQIVGINGREAMRGNLLPFAP